MNGTAYALFYAIASAIADEIQNTDNEVVDVFESVESTLVSAIADIITYKDLKLLITAKQPVNRNMLFSSLKLQNQRKSYNEYFKPLVEFN